MRSGRECVFLFLSACATLTSAAEPFCEKRDLFQADVGGHHVHHIPGIVVTARGTVLAWCEARQKGGDWDAIDLLVRRSSDAGRSWDPPQRLPQVAGPMTKNPVALRIKGVRADDVTYDNPVLIADRDGTVYGVFCVEYMRAFYIRSTDDGRSWSTPVEITAALEAVRAAYPWKVFATGPNHGIQLSTGRLIVPVWLSTGTGGNAHRPSVTATIYSDDQGHTWHAGQIAVPCTSEWVNPNETVAVELADGGVLLNVRSESPAQRRLVTVGPNGATGWSTPRFDDALVEPICMAGIVRLTRAPADKNRILFCNPANLARADGKEAPGKNRDRQNLTVQLSYDECQTWAVKRVLDPGWSAYSDIAVAHDGTILCFYGRGTKSGFAGEFLTLARFNLEWLTEGKDHLAAKSR